MTASTPSDWIPIWLRIAGIFAGVLMILWPGLDWVEQRSLKQRADFMLFVRRRKWLSTAFVLGALFLIMFAIYADWHKPTPQPSVASIEESSEDAVAQLYALGWVASPSQNGPPIFRSVNATLPPMDKSAIYFRQFGKPFALQFQGPNSLNGLHFLADLQNLASIDVDAGNFTDLSELSGFVHLKSLGLAQVPFTVNGVVDLTSLHFLTALTSLGLDSVRTDSIASVASLKNLTTLTLSGSSIKDLAPLAGLEKLQTLYMQGTPASDLTPLTKDRSLSEIVMGGAQVPGAAVLSQLKNLKTLTIFAIQPVDLSPLASLSNLTYLDVGVTFPVDLGPIGNLKGLRQLTIQGIVFATNSLIQVANAQAIGSLTGLDNLSLSSLQLSDLGFLSALSNLHTLYLGGMPVSSLSFLQNFPLLKNVSLFDMPIVEISPLLTLPKLSNLTLSRVPAREDIITLLQKDGVNVKTN